METAVKHRRCEWCADDIGHKNADARFCADRCKARSQYYRTDPAVLAMRRGQAKSRRLNPEYREMAALKRRAKAYGMTVPQVVKILSGSCEICSAPVEAIDHDHSCCPGTTTCGSCVRGGLCGSCNRGLGCFADDPVRMQSAISYLAQRKIHA